MENNEQQEHIEKEPERKEPEVLESAEIEKQIRALEEKLTTGEEEETPAEQPDKKPDESTVESVAKPENEQRTASEVAAAESDDEPMPENPGREWFIRERKKRQEERKRREEAEAKIAILENERQQMRSQPEQPVSQKQTLPPGEVFRLLVKAKNNEFGEDPTRAMSAEERNRQIIHYADKIIAEEYTSDELAAVQQQAKSGLFGEYSEAVAQAVSAAMPLVLTREMNQRKAKEEKEKQAQEHERVAKEEIAEILSSPEFKDMGDPKSELGQHLAKWEKAWIGEMKNGKFIPSNKLPGPVVIQLIAHPKLRAELARKDFLAERYATVVAERDKYKTQIDKSRQPESGTRTSVDVATGKSESEAIKAEIESRFGKLT